MFTLETLSWNSHSAAIHCGRACRGAARQRAVFLGVFPDRTGHSADQEYEQNDWIGNFHDLIFLTLNLTRNWPFGFLHGPVSVN
jgi:hypothetical protein